MSAEEIVIAISALKKFFDLLIVILPTPIWLDIEIYAAKMAVETVDEMLKNVPV